MQRDTSTILQQADNDRNVFLRGGVMKIAVTGANGFLGSRILNYYGNSQRYEMIGYSREKLDFTDWEAVKARIESDRPDILVHTGAISDVRACEKNKVLSERINVDGVRYLADVCGKSGCRMIFCSSDQVYMGSKVREPHLEEEAVSPVSVYADQKLRAEKIAFDLQPDTVVLRLSWMFAADRRETKEHGNLVSNILDAVREKKTMRYPVYDYRSLTDVWEVVSNLEVMFHATPGVYNFGSENDFSTFELVKRFLETYQEGMEFLQRNEEAFSECPRNLRMNSEKWKAAGGSFHLSVEALQKAAKEISKKEKRLP